MSYDWARSSPAPEVSHYTQLTHDGEAKFLAGTDGSRLYLGVGAQTAPGIAQMPVSGGDPVRVPAPSAYTLPVGISPDGTELLAIERQVADDDFQVRCGGCRRQRPTPSNREGAGDGCDLVSRRRNAGLLHSWRSLSFSQRQNRSTEAGFAERNHPCTAILARWQRDFGSPGRI